MDYQEAIEALSNHERYVGVKYVNGVEEAYVNPYFEKALDTAISAMQELQEYKKLGTLEEVREAVEKQKAISREIIEGKYFCHNCHNLMPYPGYCGCGQKLY